MFELFAARVNGLFDGRLDRDVFEPGSAISVGGVRDLKVVDGKFSLTGMTAPTDQRLSRRLYRRQPGRGREAGMSSPAHHHAGTGSCAQCQLPPDGTEQQRQLEAGEVLWLHEKCEEAFLQRRLAEEGLTGGTAAPSGNGAESGPAITSHR